MKLLQIYEQLLSDSSRKTINDITDLLLFKTNGYLLLYDPINKIPIGYISFALSSQSNAYSIYGAYSKNGYGPLLYELAMTYVYPNGITLDDGSGTSSEAMNVWNKFYSRPDVKKEPINRTEISYKEKELIDSCKDDVDCLESMKKILYLHNLKFSYSLGKPIFDRLVNKGNEFLKNNPNLDLEGMLYDLQG